MAVRQVGAFQWVFAPALLAIVATVVMATPFRIFGLHLPEFVFPLVLAFAWPLIRPAVVAPLVLFLLGLFLDLLWDAPLGLWALCLMSAYGLVLSVRNLLASQDPIVLFVCFSGVVTTAFVLAYFIVSFSSSSPPSLFALLGQMIPTLCLFPLAAFMIERFDDADVRFR